MPGFVRPVADERDALLAFLDQQRHLVRATAYGLTEEQARMTPTASTLSVGGLIKHLASVENNWMDTVEQRPREGSAEKYMASFRLGPDETLAGVLDDYAAAVQRTSDVVAACPDLGAPVPVPKSAPWFPQDVDAWSVRWVLLHLIEETARHLGHADILRESVDGATALPLLAAVEGWPATPWMEPWQPAGVA